MSMRVSSLLAPITALVAAALAAPRAEAAACAPWIDGASLKLERVLPPPPAAGSPEAAADMATLKAAVAARTPEDERRIAAAVPRDLAQFTGVLGAAYTARDMPRLAALVERLYGTGRAAVMAAKAEIARPRPYTLDPDLRTLGHRSGSTSYPSGHATFGYLAATVLATIVPDRRDALFARAGLYAFDRVEAGTHFPSDIAVGKVAAAVVAEALLRDPGFRCDLEAAVQDVRAGGDAPP